MRWLIVAALLLTASCGRERKFDERYEETRKQLETKSAEIDKELRQAESDAAEAGQEPNPVASPGQ